MKKLLILCTFAAFFAACDTEEGENTPKITAFAGDVTVMDNTKTPPVETTIRDVRYELDRNNDGMLVLTMPGIRFVAGMPAQTIVFPDLRCEDPDSDGVYTLTSDKELVPHIGGTPYKAYKISAFSGTVTATTLRVDFTCTADITLPNGRPLKLNHDTSFTGTKVK